MTVSDDQFLETFFAAPNNVWPNRDALHPSAAYLKRFLRALAQKGEVPLVLPRKEAGWPAAEVYVVCWSRSHAGRMRGLLNAWVEHNWCDFDGRVAQLCKDDPIEASILSFAGSGTTYRLRPPNPGAHQGLFRALGRMINAMEQRPSRVTQLPRPVGRLLRDFETSLASGQALTSLELLKTIEQSGGVSHENIAFLRLRRLGLLGADQELLNSQLLGTIVSAEPPRLVREAILGAWYRSERGDVPGDLQSLGDGLRSFGVDIALLVDETLAHTTEVDAWVASAVVAMVRGDAELADRLLGSELAVPAEARQQLEVLVQGGLAPATEREDLFDLDPEPELEPESVGDGAQNADVDDEAEMEALPVAPAVPASWTEWLASIADGDDVPLSVELVERWAPPGESDAQLAMAIQELHVSLTERLFTGLGAFIDADDPSKPARRTATEFILRHLLEDHLTPSDLGAITALLAIFLRGAPDASAYEQLLQDLAGFKGRWSSVDTAAAAIDIADLVVCAPAASNEARRGFVASALEPLHSLRHRLSESLRTVAALATADLELGWDWTVRGADPLAADNSPRVLPKSILLYSLDSGVLARAKSALAILHPSITVHVSDAKVGGDALRTHTRNAELIVLATRKATHAASLFIQANAREESPIRYADGSGSGSMMRAIEDGLQAFSS
ncbi:hypothetical protein FCN77_05700 [Arthrobacter sp. 24S4-2]|uniref:protein DpdD n=1 Tax=Arthrobacter sp. 24S4-2 TaxID=2575374 RepID=UPI0010C78196|nr:protein DpdD [Arthrobacter sp. 24S4-2]QCO97304.1 hypothetical protein FCN77_05700 [Arthrobacter sp. 24S4-2]